MSGNCWRRRTFLLKIEFPYMRDVHNTSGEGRSHLRDMAQWPSPDTIRHHRYLRG
jgi:hypothetical protein